jgi:hypothetical protein
MSFQFLHFPKSTTEKEKEKSHVHQITIGHSICFVLHGQQLKAFYGGC